MRVRVPFAAMMRRLLVALLLCSAPLACGGGKNLHKIEAPAGGVTLAYDLSPGQVYKGNVANSQSVRTTSGSSASARAIHALAAAK